METGAREQVVPLRVVPPPTITGVPWETAAGATSKRALLEPLSMRERALVCAIADTLAVFTPRVEYQGDATKGDYRPDYPLTAEEKNALLGMLTTFKDATGCAWTDAQWG